MMKNALLPWQQKNWHQLYGYVKQERVPQALLISGRKGLGKSSLAKQFAFSLLCSNPEENGFHCGKCRFCALLEAGNHPDFLEIAPEEDKSTISINQIRRVITDTSVLPQYANYRVVLINPADMLTISAANAFLKCLEEPTGQSLFVLVTDKPGKLPATISSRCQKLPANAPTAQMLKDWLQANDISDERNSLASLFEGSIMTCGQFLEKPVFNCRSDCFKEWQGVAHQQDLPAIISEKWDKLPKIDLLNWLLSWVTDIIKLKHKVGTDYLYNQDVVNSLEKLSAQIELKPLYALYDKLLVCRQQIEMQVNFQNMLEDVLVYWLEMNRRNRYG